MIDALEEAASPGTLRDLLPIVYSALLGADQVVRSAGIDLWVACAGVADALPDDLGDLAPALLADTYVVVHRRMLDQLPSLRLPARLAPSLLQLVGSWMVTYKDTDPDVVEDAIWAIRTLASMLDDEANATPWYGIGLAFVDYCRPHDRERLLTAWWPEELRTSDAWVAAALATAASPELIDYYNQRSEPLLAALMDRPGLVAHVPFAQIEPLSDIHDARFVWRAVEPVELLQAAGRWADAVQIARHVEKRQPPGTEGEPGRLFARCFVLGADMARLIVEDAPDEAGVRRASDALRQAVSDMEGARKEVSEDSALRRALDSLLAQASAAAVLHVAIVVDPAAAADELEGAADLLSRASEPVHASDGSDSGSPRRGGPPHAAALRRGRSSRRRGSGDAARCGEAAGVHPRRDHRGRRTDPVTVGLSDFLQAAPTMSGRRKPRQRGVCSARPAPLCASVGTSLLPRRGMFAPREDANDQSRPSPSACRR